jgi:hypothetical protein
MKRCSEDDITYQNSTGAYYGSHLPKASGGNRSVRRRFPSLSPRADLRILGHYAYVDSCPYAPASPR